MYSFRMEDHYHPFTIIERARKAKNSSQTPQFMRTGLCNTSQKYVTSFLSSRCHLNYMSDKQQCGHAFPTCHEHGVSSMNLEPERLHIRVGKIEMDGSSCMTSGIPSSADTRLLIPGVWEVMEVKLGGACEMVNWFMKAVYIRGGWSMLRH